MIDEQENLLVEEDEKEAPELEEEEDELDQENSLDGLPQTMGLGLDLEKLNQEQPSEEESLEEESLDDLSLELDGGDELAPAEEEQEVEPVDLLVSEDQGKYADGFPDWNLEPPLK